MPSAVQLSLSQPLHTRSFGRNCIDLDKVFGARRRPFYGLRSLLCNTRLTYGSVQIERKKPLITLCIPNLQGRFRSALNQAQCMIIAYPLQLEVIYVLGAFWIATKCAQCIGFMTAYRSSHFCETGTNPSQRHCRQGRSVVAAWCMARVGGGRTIKITPSLTHTTKLMTANTFPSSKLEAHPQLPSIPLVLQFGDYIGAKPYKKVKLWSSGIENRMDPERFR